MQAEVSLRYAEAAASAALVQVAKGQTEISGRLLTATETRAKEGVVPGVQVQRARIELDRSQRALARREAEARAANIRLAAAMGREDGAEAQAEAFPDLVTLLPTEGAPLETPDLVSKQAEVRGAAADVRVARLLGRPEFQIEARRSPFYDANNTIYPRLQFSFPLFDGKRVRNEREAAESGRKAAEQSLADARLLAQAALRAARIEFAAAGSEVASFAGTLEAARTLVLRSEVGLTEGATTFTDTLEAVRALRDVEEGLVESKRRLAEATVELLQAGGVILPAMHGGAR